MKILLKSSDAKALDSAVRQIIAAANGPVVPLVLPSIASKFLHTSRRLVFIKSPDADTMTRFATMLFSSNVNVTIS